MPPPPFICSTISFDASTLEIWGALLRGGRCVVYPDRVPTTRELGEVIAREGVTTLWLTASLFNAVVDEAPEALAPVRQLLIGGEALSVPHVRKAQERLAGTQIVNGYGPTEGTTFTCCHAIPPGLPAGARSVPIGRQRTRTQPRASSAAPRQHKRRARTRRPRTLGRHCRTRRGRTPRGR